MAIKKFATSFNSMPASVSPGTYFNIINDVTNQNIQILNNGDGQMWAEQSLAHTGSTCFGANSGGRMEFLFMDPVLASLGLGALTTDANPIWNPQIYMSTWVYFPLGYKWGSWMFLCQFGGGQQNWNPSSGIMMYDPYNDGVSPFQVCFKTNQGTGTSPNPSNGHEGVRTLWNPRGKWSHIEYFQTFDPVSASVWAKIDGNYIFNYPAGSFYCAWHGRTELFRTVMTGDVTRKHAPLNMYSDVALNPIYWDDLELWDDVPGVTPPPTSYNLTINSSPITGIPYTLTKL